MIDYNIDIIETSDCIYFYAILNKENPIGCLEIIPQNTNKYLLHKIFILPEYRNNKIATNLILNLFEYLKNKDFEIYLQVIPDVYNFSEINQLQNKLIKFYKKFGFKVYDILKTKYFYIPLMKR